MKRKIKQLFPVNTKLDEERSVLSIGETFVEIWIDRRPPIVEKMRIEYFYEKYAPKDPEEEKFAPSPFEIERMKRTYIQSEGELSPEQVLALQHWYGKDWRGYCTAYGPFRITRDDMAAILKEYQHYLVLLEARKKEKKRG